MDEADLPKHSGWRRSLRLVQHFHWLQPAKSALASLVKTSRLTCQSCDASLTSVVHYNKERRIVYGCVASRRFA